MAQAAIIYKVQFTPLIEPQHSTLRIYLVLPDEDRLIRIQEQNTESILSRKYGFTIENGGWDLRNMHLRNCFVEIDEKAGNHIFAGYR